MPTTLEGFLERDEALAALRRQIDAAEPRLARILRGDERALVSMLASRWDIGVAGWLTVDEAADIAAELNTDAAYRRLAAWAEVRDDELVFCGGRHGEHRLALSATGPVLVRRRWPEYLRSCPPSGRLRRLVAQLELLAQTAWRRR